MHVKYTQLKFEAISKSMWLWVNIMNKHKLRKFINVCILIPRRQSVDHFPLLVFAVTRVVWPSLGFELSCACAPLCWGRETYLPRPSSVEWLIGIESGHGLFASRVRLTAKMTAIQYKVPGQTFESGSRRLPWPIATAILRTWLHAVQMWFWSMDRCSCCAMANMFEYTRWDISRCRGIKRALKLWANVLIIFHLLGWRIVWIFRWRGRIDRCDTREVIRSRGLRVSMRSISCWFSGSADSDRLSTSCTTVEAVASAYDN